MSDIAQSAALTAEAPAAPSRGYWAGVWQRLRQDRVSLGCAGVLALLILSAIFAPWIGLQDPYQGSMISRLKPIGTEGHLLGTDELGRDMLARLIYGGGRAVFFGVFPVLAALLVGATPGAGGGGGGAGRGRG